MWVSGIATALMVTTFLIAKSTPQLTALTSQYLKLIIV